MTTTNGIILGVIVLLALIGGLWFFASRTMVNNGGQSAAVIESQTPQAQPAAIPAPLVSDPSAFPASGDMKG